MKKPWPSSVKTTEGEQKNKLWSNKPGLNPEVEAFETKGDLIMDQKLIPYDLLGSIAHAKGLKKIGILSDGEFIKIEKGLSEIQDLYKKGKFNLEFGDEDCHTKIENYLTQKYGEVGEKIHTGRSRNDQVLTAIRLYSKEKLAEVQRQLLALVQSFHLFSKKYGSIPMPGYTHMQKAMPSTVGIWANSFKESLTDDLSLVKGVYKLNNQCPLGSGPGYGVPLNLEREFTAEELKFAKVQKNPLYCQNSRGKIEAAILASLISIFQTINKFASDLMLFTTSEFNFFSVSDEITTGSSIMPQKKNLDLAELLRSKLHLSLGNYVQIVSLSSNLVSGYNKDLQDIKKPLIESFEITLDSLKAAKILLENINPNQNILEKAMTEDLYATSYAYELVKKGIPFRKAYSVISSDLSEKSQDYKSKSRDLSTGTRDDDLKLGGDKNEN